MKLFFIYLYLYHIKGKLKNVNFRIFFFFEEIRKKEKKERKLLLY